REGVLDLDESSVDLGQVALDGDHLLQGRDQVRTGARLVRLRAEEVQGNAYEVQVFSHQELLREMSVTTTLVTAMLARGRISCVNSWTGLIPAAVKLRATP